MFGVVWCGVVQCNACVWHGACVWCGVCARVRVSVCTL